VPFGGAGNGGGAFLAPGSPCGHLCAGAQVTASRRETLWGEVAAHAAGQGPRVSVADVCAVAVWCAQATGAWVTAASGPAPEFVMCVTDPVSEQLAELQLTLGEGPCHDVLASAGPHPWPATWAMTRPAAGGPPSHLDGAGHDGDEGAGRAGLDGQAPGLAAHRTEIDQATGMLTLQLGVTAAEAFARLRAYAYAQDRRLADVAGDIVARRLRLHPDPGRAPDGKT